MAKQIITYKDFSGGLNLDTAPDLLKDNELRVAMNAVIDKGPAPKRDGFDNFNATTFKVDTTDNHVESMFEWRRNDGTTFIMAVVGLVLKKIAYPAGTVTNVKTLSAADIGCFVYADTFYFTGKESGTDKYWSYDGTTCAEVTAASGADLSNIKKCRDFTWHPSSQRIFASKDSGNPSRLYWSALGAPNNFKSLADFVLPTTGDGPITALENFGNSMVAFFSSSAWAWTGVDPTVDAKWQRIPISTGAVGKKAVAMTPNTLTYVDIGGVMSLTLGATNYDIVAVTGQQVQNDLSRDKVSEIVKGILHTDTVQVLYDKMNDRFIIAYGDEVGNSRNNKFLVYQWKAKAWSQWDGITPNCLLQLADGTVLVGSKNYILKQVNDLYKDFDVDTGLYKAIEWEIETKGYPLLDGAQSYADKRLYKMVFAVRQFKTIDTSVTVSILYDYAGWEFAGISYTGVDLSESLTWDDEWNEVWGWTDIVKKEVKLRGKGARVSVNYKNSVIDEQAVVYGQAFVFKAKKLKAGRVTGGVDIG